MTKKGKVGKWLYWTNMSFASYEKLNALQTTRWEDANALFVERLQATDGFFKARVLDFVEPKDWKVKDPCIVTVYRNGYYDTFSDEIFNAGNSADVKEYFCPCYKEGKKCDQAECIYCARQNEYLELDKKIPHAQEIHDKIVARRKAAWHAIWHRTK